MATEDLGPLSERHKRFVQVLEFVHVERVLPGTRGSGPGRPPESRAFLAKAVFDVPTTRALVERLRTDLPLRRLCVWDSAGAVPSEATFSRASTAIPARERPAHKSKPAKKKCKRGRPRKGEQRQPQLTRLERQVSITLAAMLEDLLLNFR